MAARMFADLPEDALTLHPSDHTPESSLIAAESAPGEDSAPSPAKPPGALPEFWSQRALTVTVAGASGERKVRLATPFARVGSLPNADVVLAGDDVPSRALYLHATEEGVFCLPLVEPTENGKLFHGWLEPGQWIAVGPYQICAEWDVADVGPRDEAPALDAKLLTGNSQPSIAVMHHGRLLESRSLARPVTIFGRTQPSTVRVRDPGLSGCHCALYWTGEAMWVVDLVSTGGTFMGGAPVAAALLPTGQPLQAGNVEIVVGKPGEVSSGTILRGKGRSGPSPSRREEDVAAHELAQFREQASRLAEELDQTRAAHAKEASALRERLGRLTATLAEQEEAFTHDRAEIETERRRLESLLTQREEQSELLQKRLEHDSQERSVQFDHVQGEFVQQQAAWERDREAMEHELARISQELQSAHEARKQVETSHVALVARLEGEMGDGSALVQNLRGKIDQLQQANAEGAAALAQAQASLAHERHEASRGAEEEQQRYESAIAEKQAFRRELECQSERALATHCEEIAQIQQASLARDAALNETIQQLRRAIEQLETAALESSAAWEEERRRLESLAAQEHSRPGDLEQESARADQIHQEEIARIQQASFAREAALNETIEQLRRTMEDHQAAAHKNVAAWEEERRRWEAAAAAEQSVRGRLEQQSARAEHAHQEEIARIQQASVVREAALNDTIQQLRRTMEEHRTSVRENAAARAQERRRLKALTAEERTRRRELEREIELAKQAQQEESARLQQALLSHQAMLDHTAPEFPVTTVQNESATGPGRPVSETEERFFESADIDEDSCLSEAESYVVSLDPADSAGADLAGIHRAPRSNSLEAESAFPEDAHSAPEIGFDDPEALDRMVRFARHKRGRLLPALRKAALYVLWGSAIVVALAAALFLAGRLAQEYLP